MLYFGSRNFGQANFGKGLITTAVDETLTTSTMQVAGYRLIADCAVDPGGVVNVDVAAGMVRLGHLDIRTTSTIITSGILMEWHPSMARIASSNTTQISGFIAWDSQFVDEGTWTTQTVD